LHFVFSFLTHVEFARKQENQRADCPTGGPPGTPEGAARETALQKAPRE
jgi:hypothetical protein